MIATLPLGRVFDIRLGLHVSWLALYALVTWSVASTFGALDRPVAFVLAALCALVVFASLVAHELAHALVARRFGVRTAGITLFLFGGVATLENEPPTPRAEIAIALAGPIASALLALGFFGAGTLLDRVPGPTGAAFALVAIYLAIANGVLAAFNVIPAFPMDGGRVLRAIVWAAGTDYRRATRVSSSLGVALGLLGALAAAFAVVRTHEWPYAWYVVLAGFVTYTGWVSLRAARTHPG